MYRTEGRMVDSVVAFLQVEQFLLCQVVSGRVDQPQLSGASEHVSDTLVVLSGGGLLVDHWGPGQLLLSGPLLQHLDPERALELVEGTLTGAKFEINVFTKLKHSIWSIRPSA